MKLSYNWIKEFIEIKVSVKDLGDKLRSLGFEIAGEEKKGDDVIFDVEITPNRGDCLSVVGITREISAGFGLEMKIKKTEINGSCGKINDSIKIEINEPLLCPRYTARMIKGLRVGPSPDWMVKRLESLGVRSINNVVDATNYVLLETGQPLHAFDYSLIRGSKIIVRKANENEKIITLDGVERKLDKSMLVIADNNRAIAIAGVMGGANTEVNLSTKDVVIESACFNASSIRKTSQLLNLSTDASYRFERSSDIDEAMLSVDRVCSLIKEIAGGDILKGVLDIYPVKKKQKNVKVRFSRIEKILGIKIKQKDSLAILKKLGFTVKTQKSFFTVTIPSWRESDVMREIDVVEEIARVYGYNNINAILPSCDLGDETKYETVGSGLLDVQDAVRKILTGFGFFECINYGFIRKGVFEKVLSGDSELVAIKNPLDEEMDKLRPSLIPWLVENLVFNFNRDAEVCRIFETGHIFRMNKAVGLPEEEIMVSCVISGQEKNFWSDKKRQIDFYDIKGAAEFLFEKLGIEGVQYSALKNCAMSVQGLDVFVGDERIGVIGKLKEEIIKYYKLANEVLFFEFKLAVLERLRKKIINYLPFSKFPAVRRDAALLIPLNVTMEEVVGLIKKNSNELLVNIALFDCYEGGQIPKGLRSLAFNFTYQSNKKTLTDQEVNDVHFAIIGTLAEKGIKLRA